MAFKKRQSQTHYNILNCTVYTRKEQIAMIKGSTQSCRDNVTHWCGFGSLSTFDHSVGALILCRSW